ncbi:MalY/PatB family protein [Paenibacillus larvae]|uniref:cysteine-S-conjugate beta-lyase n=1 Tax=Paenibacillus larvae TaxID=1464 RepID=A0AAP5JU94_9BACL|nr:MalY/PatB family protein [Paenibacillus larvae]AQR78348.1 cystathionine beta-lyase [Paenibacillus larvae subsp. larvae]AVF20432.1 cystathionine beta-lyase PatB [Paenibacillus larvae subsp. larvae]ETK28615.1 cystathionine beta-lyase PatB [Paenibacillus larvae subsp. larvae DSM 25719]MCY7478644.1 pyridoxal phosphate-dependent aminotransferase [Paenibacillus larvae]MCY7491164.1 pyridoxal phosphate-dependent aminotransferase [Paenibacillus larvae]
MQYDFDQLIHRKQTASKKWDGLKEVFGESDLLPMWVADMDFKSPLPVIEKMIQRANHGIFGYNLRPDSYYDTIVQWMSDKHQWSIRRDWICYSPGVMTAISLIISHFSEPWDSILIQPPVYAPFSQVIKRNNRKLVTSPLRYDNGRYLIDFDDLQKKLDKGVKIFLLCSPHNPVGRVWTKDELKQVGEMCLKRNVLVISDEIHADLVYPGNSHTPFGSISKEFSGRSFVCTSPSKTFNLPGIQTANIIIPDRDLREKFETAAGNYYLEASNTFGVVATEAAYREGAEWLEQCLAYVKQNLEFLKDYINQHIPEIRVTESEGTYLAWLDCRGLHIDGKNLENLMIRQAKVAVVSGYTFGSEREGFIRINLAAPRALLKEGLDRINRAIKEKCC